MWRVRMFRHVGEPYVQRLSTRYLERPRPTRALAVAFGSFIPPALRAQIYAELRREKDLHVITVRPLLYRPPRCTGIRRVIMKP